jgi:Protein of unknown function (DUF3307)
MPWVEIFAVFIVCHLVGDFALQTAWQAHHKFGGLGADPTARRALFSHVGTYTLAFVPAFVWLADETGAALLVALAAILIVTHLVVDDGRLLHAYIRRVKRTEPRNNPIVTVAVDQMFHVVILFGMALLGVT